MELTKHTIAIHQVAQMLHGARLQGLDVDRILNRVGIAPTLLDAPLARVSQEQYAHMLRLLSRRMRDEFWGLGSRPLPLGSFAQGCRILIQCRDLREALQTGLHYYRLVLADFAARLRVVGGVAHVTLTTSMPLDARTVFAQRAFLFLAYGLASWLVARRVPLLWVDYRGADVGQRSDASRLFQAPIRYDQLYSGIAFDARWLDLPVMQNSSSLKEFLVQVPGNLLVKYRDHSSITERIRRILRRHLSEEMPSLEEVGKVLAMTPQTLRRRLHDEGQGYQALKDALRRDAAIEYLARADLSLIDIAEKLGFSEPSTFHRAFKKWTGVAPGEYRHTRLKAT